MKGVNGSADSRSAATVAILYLMILPDAIGGSTDSASRPVISLKLFSSSMILVFSDAKYGKIFHIPLPLLTKSEKFLRKWLKSTRF